MPQTSERTGIFTESVIRRMTRVANRYDAINLSQGFPDFECDPALLDLVNGTMREGLNQYPPMPGVAPLRQAVAKKFPGVLWR